MPRLHAQAALARLLNSTPLPNDAPPPFGLYRSTSARYIYWATNNRRDFNNRAVFMAYYSQVMRFNVAWAETRSDTSHAIEGVLATLSAEDQAFWRPRTNPYTFESIYHLPSAQFMPNNTILAGEGRMNPRTWHTEREQPLYLPQPGRRYRQSLFASWAPYTWVLTVDDDL